MPTRALLVLSILVVPVAAGALTVTDLGSSVRVTTTELTVTVDEAPFRLTVADARETLLQEAAGASASLAYTRGGVEYRVAAVIGFTQTGSEVAFDCTTTEGGSATVTLGFTDEGTLSVTLAPPTPGTVTRAGETLVAFAGEHYYGLTERIVSEDGPFSLISEVAPQAVGGLDRRGEAVTMSVTATIAIYTPFFHSSRGYGLFVDGPMQGTYDLAKSAPDRVAFVFDFDPATQVFRYWLFHGPDHATILDRYTTRTGRPWLPPRWVYRHMRWRDEHAAGPTAVLDGVAMNADLVEDVTMYETLGFPAPGWYNFDRPWTAGAKGGCPSPGFARFAFDPARFPNAPEMLAALAARGTRTIVFNAPWACGSASDPADDAFEAAANGWYAPGSPDHIDFTNPAALAWWRGKVGDFVDATGVSGFKLDRGDETVPSQATDVYADGRTGPSLHNDYPRLYVQAYGDELEARRPGDWVTMTRPGYAGSQAYGVYWGGDITGAESFGTGPGTDKGLRSALISLQRLAFMGFPNWGTDTGGYYQFKQRDVFGRWLEFSALCPVMEIGGGRSVVSALGGPHAPWAMPTTPTYDPEMIALYRYYTWLHHELVPYAYGEGIRAHETGHPIATPLVFVWPDDPAVADLWDEYLYGPWLLVAPVWQDGDRARSVYLPAASWVSWWDDDTVVTGPTTLADVAAPLGQLPLFVQLGAILPLEVANDATGHGTTASAGRLTLDLYPHHDSTYRLRDADGAIDVTSTKAGAYGDVGRITITTSPSTRSWLLRVKASFRPARVTLDGVPLVESADQAAFDAAAAGWLWLSAERRVLAKYATTAAPATVVLEPACTVTSAGQTTWAKTRLVASHVHDGNADRFVLRGEFTLPADAADVDPLANGARVELRSGHHDPLVTVVLPGGSGWRRRAHGTRFVFRAPGGTAGVARLIVTRRGGGRVRILVVGRGTFPLAATDLPLEASVVLGGTAAGASGACGEVSFADDRCRAVKKGKRIDCR